MNQTILVTGAAGFIGFHLCKKLLDKGFTVIGIDNINNYYDVSLKKKRLGIIDTNSKKKNLIWKFIKTDIINENHLLKIFKRFKPNTVIHLAAQAGVRYSLKNPSAYIQSNIVGFSNILECCRLVKVKNLLYASSSSVYGGNTKTPFSENDPVNHPVSLYAATKRSNELMAHVYSDLYNISATGLRFFTVYGPWGRPDMAPMIFADAILRGKTLKVYNYGEMTRSFTYIDDVIEIVIKLINKPALPDKFFNKSVPNPSSSWCSHRIFNIGNDKSVELKEFISYLEKALGSKANKDFVSMQKGDVVNTLSENSLISDWIDNSPKTSINEGIKNFVDWYKKFYTD